jgi:hypothetical protein
VLCSQLLRAQTQLRRRANSLVALLASAVETLGNHRGLIFCHASLAPCILLLRALTSVAALTALVFVQLRAQLAHASASVRQLLFGCAQLRLLTVELQLEVAQLCLGTIRLAQQRATIPCTLAYGRATRTVVRALPHWQLVCSMNDTRQLVLQQSAR